ncbi:translin-like protein [Haematococcus lacustris]|uniref:Translin-like protein n=1 Tax=Haematococcus lacustris TaxID=44745 RepID=A0A699Z5W8_HAELA|nr:translin-like protein [Haematococcus lacustris]
MYAEAQAFLYFLREGRLVAAKELPLVEPEEYLGGILDMTGELNRYAVLRATARDTAAVARCRDLVDSMMGKFLQVAAGGSTEFSTSLISPAGL